MPINYPDPGARKAYWDAHKPDGAPDEPVVGYIDHIESRNPNETWSEFTARVDTITSHTLRGSNLTMAIYGENAFDGVAEPSRLGVDELLLRGAVAYSPDAQPDARPFIAWVRCSPCYHIVNQHADSDFEWSRVRCFLAGAGHANWAGLVEQLTRLYPLCPFDGLEDAATWLAGTTEAHVKCGWPVHLAHITIHSLRNLLGVFTPGSSYAPRWVGWCSLLHILKHTRYSPSQGVVIHHRGTSSAVERESTNIIGAWTKGRVAILAAFQYGGVKAGKIHVLDHALKRTVDNLDVNHLIVKKPLASIPASKLVGPWSSCQPDPLNFDGFYQTGQRVTGMWEAEAGTVRPYHGTQQDVIDYDWNVLTPAQSLEALEQFTRTVPTTYEPTWASDIFLKAFPNWESGWYPDRDQWAAAKTLFDVPIVASLLRATHPTLAQEFPAVVFMPQHPSPHQSTNQGKSLAVLSYARAINPSVQKLLSVADSGSAPDIRSVASEIRSVGSLAVDEFTPPKNATHILAHDNFQALCTGSSITSGRVYENDGRVSLSASMVFSAKVYDVPIDIQNRSLVHWLGDLTDEMRANAVSLQAIRSGALSIRMRLGLWAVLERSGIPGQFAATLPQSTTRGLRFDGHRTLSMLLLCHRIGCTPVVAYELLDSCITVMGDHMRSHVTDAIDTGLMASMEFGSALRLRFQSLFEDLDPHQLESMRGYLRCYSTTRGSTYNKPGDFIGSWMELRGIQHRPLSDILPILTGSRRHTSDRSVRCAIAASLQGCFTGGRDRWMLPGICGLNGWAVIKHEEDAYELKNLHPSAGAVHALPVSGLRNPINPQPDEGTTP
jgi:hypothetical protein